MYLARYAKKVHIIVRADGLERSMSHYLIEQIAATPNIEVHTGKTVCGADGADRLERLTFAWPGGKKTIDAHWLFVFIGAEPGTGWLDGLVERDPRGYVLTGPDLVGQRPPPAAGRSSASPTTWRRASPACSPRATSAPSR